MTFVLPQRALWTTAALVWAATSPSSATRAAVDDYEGELPETRVVETYAPGSPSVAVRVELALGTRDEAAHEADRGLAAAAAAALWAAEPATSGTSDGEPIRRWAARAGLTLRVSLTGSSTALTVSGPPESLEVAVWAGAAWVRALGRAAPDGAAARAGLWVSAVESMYEAVSPQGDAVETTLWALLGEEGGRSAYASRAAAARLDDEALGALTRRAWREAAARGPVLVVVAAPSRERRRARGAVARWLRPLESPEGGSERAPGEAGDAPTPKAHGALEPARPRPSGFKVEPPGARDTRLVLAWDLVGVERLVGTSPKDTAAALLTLSALLGHAGGPVRQRLVDAARLARGASCLLWSPDGQGGATMPAALVLEVTVAERGAVALRDARAALDRALGRLQRGRLDERAARGAARLAAQGLRARWARAPARAALVAGLVRHGRGEARWAKGWADAWLAGLLRALERQTPADVARVAAWALHPDRRVVGVFRTKSPEGEALTPEKIETYERVAVDITCPRGGERPDVAALLALKYHMTTGAYVALARAIAKRPGLLREVSRAVHDRCAEYAKLRSMMTISKALALHEALACEVGRTADEGRRERRLRRLFRRFGLDPSVYRPLIEMLREEPDASRRVQAIDARCRPRYGPAARWAPGEASGESDSTSPREGAP